MLETIRAYALEQLQERGEAETLRRAHAAYYLALIEEVDSGLALVGNASRLHRLDAEHDNLRAVLRRAREQGDIVTAGQVALALWPFWQVRGHLSEGRAWLETILAEGEAVPAALRVRLLHGADVLAYEHGDYGQATRRAEESLALARDLGDTQGIAYAWSTLGLVARHRGDYDTAAQLFADSASHFCNLADHQGLALALVLLCSVARYRGEHARLRALAQESLALFEGAGNNWGMAMAFNNLGYAAQDQEDYERARAYFERSLALNRGLRNRAGIAASLDRLGDVTCYQHDHERATILYAESLTLYQDLGDQDGIAHSLMKLGRVAAAQGHYGRSRDLFEESLALQQVAGSMWGILDCIEGLAGVAATNGQPQRATHLYGAAAALRAAIHAPFFRPADRIAHDRSVLALRMELGEAAFERAWTRGTSLSVEQAINEALADAGRSWVAPLPCSLHVRSHNVNVSTPDPADPESGQSCPLRS